MKRKNETFTQLVVGFFMVTLMALLAYFTIVVSGVDLLTGRSRVQVKAVFSQVGGLKEHDNVMYRGTKVGSVDRVEVTPSNLVVTAVVDGGVILRTFRLFGEYRMKLIVLTITLAAGALSGNRFRNIG